MSDQVMPSLPSTAQSAISMPVDSLNGRQLRKSCRFCRSRKIRCSGEKDIGCRACRSRQQQCRYEPTATMGRPRKYPRSESRGNGNEAQIAIPPAPSHHFRNWELSAGLTRHVPSTSFDANHTMNNFGRMTLKNPRDDPIPPPNLLYNNSALPGFCSQSYAMVSDPGAYRFNEPSYNSYLPPVSSTRQSRSELVNRYQSLPGQNQVSGEKDDDCKVCRPYREPTGAMEIPCQYPSSESRGNTNDTISTILPASAAHFHRGWGTSLGRIHQLPSGTVGAPIHNANHVGDAPPITTSDNPTTDLMFSNSSAFSSFSSPESCAIVSDPTAHRIAHGHQSSTSQNQISDRHASYPSGSMPPRASFSPHELWSQLT